MEWGRWKTNLKNRKEKKFEDKDYTCMKVDIEEQRAKRSSSTQVICVYQ